MKLIAKYLKRLYNENNHSEVTFLIDNFQHQSMISDLDKDKVYKIELKEVKSQRSIQQNKYLWSLIRELSLKTQEDDWDLYVKLLESANASYTYIWALESAEETLRSSFRAIKKMGVREVIGGDGKLVSGFQYKLYEGSSKFNTQEMALLLETLIMWCEAEGIQTDILLYE